MNQTNIVRPRITALSQVQIEQVHDYSLQILSRSLFRKAYYDSPIFPRQSLEKWQKLDHPRAIDMLRDYTRQMIDDLVAPDDHADLMGRGEDFIAGLVARQS